MQAALTVRDKQSISITSNIKKKVSHELKSSNKTASIRDQVSRAQTITELHHKAYYTLTHLLIVHFYQD